MEGCAKSLPKFWATRHVTGCNYCFYAGDLFSATHEYKQSHMDWPKTIIAKDQLCSHWKVLLPQRETTQVSFQFEIGSQWQIPVLFPILSPPAIVLFLGRWDLLSGSICCITLSIMALCLFLSVKRKIYAHIKQLNTRTRGIICNPLNIWPVLKQMRTKLVLT